MTVHLHKESNKINIRRGVRTGDIISHKLFTAALERIFRRLTWETRGLKIDGEYLNHFRFADDILICINSAHELQQMQQEFADESEYQGLKMNKSKTEVMMENDMNMSTTLRSRTLKATYTWNRDTAQEKKPRRFKEETLLDGPCLKSLQLMRTSGNDTRRGHIGTHHPSKERASIHTNMERIMLNIKYRDRKTNIWVREKTKVTDVIEQVRRQNWTWAGHVSRIRYNPWTLRTTTWKPYKRKRPRGIPSRCSRDELDGYRKGAICITTCRWNNSCRPF